MAMVLSGAVLFAQTEESLADKLSFSLEFEASILSVESDGENVVVDSFTDAGFNEDETKIGLAYEDELWGASVSLKFGNENLRFLNGEVGEMFADFPLALDELYGWVRPFGSRFKFTGGIFENTDGVADYTDDIDHFSMGVFMAGEGGDPYAEPEETTNAALVSGLLSEAVFGPITLQFLLAPNYSKESASDLASGLLTQMSGQSVTVDADARFFRYGGRVIADLGVGTIAALFKTFQWPITIVNAVEGASYPGTKMNWVTFGGYFDLTAVEGLGVSLGYTGILPTLNASDVDNVLYSGIDLRAAWTGIEGFSISTHNNLSFAKGSEKDWSGALLGKDASFISLYNAVGATKELTEKFSVNAEVSNLFSKTKIGSAPAVSEVTYNTLGVGGKFIVTVGEHAEFNAGLRVDFEKATATGADSETMTTFSVPVGIVISF
jgi:hypothetical protein